jgi:hypothetical protein
MQTTAAKSNAAPVARRAVVAVTVAVSIFVLGRWSNRGLARAAQEVTVLRGKADSVNISRTAIGFDGRRVAGPRLRIVDAKGSWIVAGASWSDGRAWHDQDTPTCLDADTLPRPIEMGVLEAKPHGDAPGRGVVVWLKCLDRAPGG